MIPRKRENIYSLAFRPRNTRKMLFCALAVFSRLGGVSFAAEEKTVQLAQAPVFPVQNQLSALSTLMQGKITLDLRNIEAVDALKFLAMKTGLNIVVTKSVTGRVSLTVQDAPIKDIFDIMLRLNSLAYDKTGEIYNVMTETEYKALYGKKFSDSRQVKIFRLNYAIPEQAFNLLDALKSEIGRLLVDTESGTVMVMDIPDKINEAQHILETLEQKASIKIFNLKYAKAKDVEDQLKEQLDIKKAGTIKADERTNQVIVQTLPERMESIGELIRGLDKKTKAVMVDTKIIKLKYRNQLDSGIEWEGIFNLAKQAGINYIGSYPFSVIQKSTEAWKSRESFFNNTMAGSIGAYPFSGTATEATAGSKVSPGEKFHVGIIDKKKDFDVLIKYLQTLGKTKILSNPTLSVVENQEAKIHVGERQAYITTSTTVGSGGTKTTSEEVTYVDVGIQLAITPQINEDGYVIIKVKPEISSIIDYVTSSEGNKIPIIDTSTAETTVIAKDGSTIMLGGLGREEKTESSEQVPILGSIPFLGMLFRSKTQKVERIELIIMLTPVIFEGDKMVSTKDREMERFGVKPFKKFDVFREEPIYKEGLSPVFKEPPENKEAATAVTETKAVREDSEKIQPSPDKAGIPALGREKFYPKNFKEYAIIDSPQGYTEFSKVSRVPVSEDKKEEVLPKGFRGYN